MAKNSYLGIIVRSTEQKKSEKDGMDKGAFPHFRHDRSFPLSTFHIKFKFSFPPARIIYICLPPPSPTFLILPPLRALLIRLHLYFQLKPLLYKMPLFHISMCSELFARSASLPAGLADLVDRPSSKAAWPI